MPKLVADDVVALDLSGPVKTVTLGEGQVVSARSVILAMGSAYRELGLPDEATVRAGSRGARPATASSSRDQDIAVVGGGDSAVEATFLPSSPAR